MKKKRRQFSKKYIKRKVCIWCGADMTDYVKQGLIGKSAITCSDECRKLWIRHYKKMWQRNNRKRIANNVRRWRKKQKKKNTIVKIISSVRWKRKAKGFIHST